MADSLCRLSILCKDNASRMQSQACLSYAEAQLILYKDNASRMQSQACLSYAEPQLILCKDKIKLQNAQCQVLVFV